MPAPTIDELPAAPNRLTDSQSAFITKADAFMAAMVTFAAQVGEFADYMNTVGSGGNANGFAFETVAVSAGDTQVTVSEYTNINHFMVLLNGYPQTGGYSGPDSTHIDFDEPLPAGVVTLVRLATY